MPSLDDVLAQCVAVIEGGVDPDPGHLSRRRRSAGVAVDVAGDAACVLIVRRGAGVFHWDHHLLSHAGGRWRLLGGGGGSRQDDGLDERPLAAELSGHLALTGGGSGVLEGGGGLWPWSGRWIEVTDLRASRDVRTVRIGDRPVTVPRHGHLVAVSASRRPVTVTAFDPDGELLATVRAPGARHRPVSGIGRHRPPRAELRG